MVTSTTTATSNSNLVMLPRSKLAIVVAIVACILLALNLNWIYFETPIKAVFSNWQSPADDQGAKLLLQTNHKKSVFEKGEDEFDEEFDPIITKKNNYIIEELSEIKEQDDDEQQQEDDDWNLFSFLRLGISENGEDDKQVSSSTQKMNLWESAFDSVDHFSLNYTRRPTRRPTRPPRPRPNVTTSHNNRPPIQNNRTQAPTPVKVPLVYIPPDIQNTTILEIQAKLCDERFEKAEKGEVDPYLQADCGLGYDLPNPNRTMFRTNNNINGRKSITTTAGKDSIWRVFFVGSEWGMEQPLRKYSGCPKECPLSPQCSLFYDSNVMTHGTELADVAVGISFHYRDFKASIHPRVKHRVMYWREASWSGPPISYQKSPMFSFEMGVHLNAALLNPAFMLRPNELLKGFDIPLDKSTAGGPSSSAGSYFAASVISDCAARSKRDEYQRAMMEFLGPGKIHRYGKCGERNLPGSGLKSALKRLAKYKFFLAFENNIQQGYLTEKLFTAMMLPRTVPVYYGAHPLFNITTTPSFIRAIDFRTPADLASYLVHLANNPREFERYFDWRKSKKPFTSEFLKLVASKVPGPKEVLLHKGSMRSALCCRLCDESFVERASATKPKSSMYVDSALTGEECLASFIETLPPTSSTELIQQDDDSSS